MNEKQMFDYESVADQYKIDKKTLDKILSDLREEFPGDEMMVELHAIRIMKNMSSGSTYEKEKYLS